MYQNHYETESGIIVVSDRGFFPIHKSNPLFNTVLNLIQDKDYDELVDVVDLAGRIRRHTSGRFWVDDDGNIMLKGEVLPKALSRKLLKFIDDKVDTGCLENFWDLLRQNPTESAVQETFAFIDYSDIGLTANGKIKAYKRVTRLDAKYFDPEQSSTLDIKERKELGLVPGDLVDTYTKKTHRNNPGDVVEMPRDEVTIDKHRTCAAGLHVAAYAYADDMYSDGVFIEVEIDPRDVVSIPKDHQNKKMRCCKYKVIRICKGPRYDGLIYEVGDHVIYEDVDGPVVRVVEEVIKKDPNDPEGVNQCVITLLDGTKKTVPDYDLKVYVHDEPTDEDLQDMIELGNDFLNYGKK